MHMLKLFKHLLAYNVIRLLMAQAARVKVVAASVMQLPAEYVERLKLR